MITEAARQAFVTQPMISNSVRDLEKEIGIEIFSRNFLFAGFPRRYSVSSFEASELSETVISRTLPLNIFLRPFIKSMLSSSFLV